MKIYSVILFIFISISLSAQNLVKDQDLVTLKSGAQYLGYIIEQQPGKLIKIYRPSENDTITINMEDIDKFTKIYVQAYSSKKRTKNDSVLSIGRYNNKKNIYQFSFVAINGEGINGYLGGSLAYYRNIKNRYMPGLSFTMCGFEGTSGRQFDSTIATYGHESYSYYKQNVLVTIMYENKIRIGNLKKPQNHRLTSLLGLNIGYVFDLRDEYTRKYNYENKYFENYRKQTGNNFIFQLTYSFKINPDNNSGFILEPGIAYYSPITKIHYSKYTIKKQTPINYSANGKPDDISTEYNVIANDDYLGYTKRDPWLFSFRLSYFF